jgi:hypothetical protein
MVPNGGPQPQDSDGGSSYMAEKSCKKIALGDNSPQFQESAAGWGGGFWGESPVSKGDHHTSMLPTTNVSI